MITYYPDKTTLKEVLDSKVSTSDLKKICKTRGIFVLSQEKKDLLDTASKIFWGCNEINYFSQIIDDSKNYKKSVQWLLEGKDQNNPFDEFLEKMRSKQRSQTNESLVLIENITPVNAQGVTEIEIKHIRRQVGRVKLLQKIERYFTIQIHADNPNESTVNIIHNDNSDLKVAKDLLDFNDDSDNYNTKQVKLDVLTIHNRVELFDRFFQHDHNNWRREEIISIGVEAGELTDDDDGDGGEDEQDILNGINSALIHGSGLRSNQFVQRCLDQGYYFTQTVVKFAHRQEAIKINLGLQFKDNDKFAELSLLSSYEVENDIDYRKVLSLDEQKDYLQHFHKCLYGLFDNLLDEQRPNN